MKRPTTLLLVLIAAACAPAGVSPGAPAPTSRPARNAPQANPAPARVSGRDAATADALSRSILEEVNAARARSGSQALQLDPAMQKAAQRYAVELARRGELDHDSPTPSLRTFRERLAAQGAHPRMAGENLALLTETPRGLPSHVVHMWLGSPGHRENLLEPRYSRTGVGVALGAQGIWYVAEEYGTNP